MCRRAAHVHFRDHDLTAFDDAALTHYRREHVGFVFQFYNLIPSLTARENVALITEIAANPDPRRRKHSSSSDSGERMDHFPSQMSGGEQQRVAIARAIAKRPDVLLCDEPTGALDVKTGIIVLEAIERVNRELGTTTAVITHNAVIAGMADRVITISDGRIASTSPNEGKTAARELDLVKMTRAQSQTPSRHSCGWQAQAIAISLVMACGVATLCDVALHLRARWQQTRDALLRALRASRTSSRI